MKKNTITAPSTRKKAGCYLAQEGAQRFDTRARHDTAPLAARSHKNGRYGRASRLLRSFFLSSPKRVHRGKITLVVLCGRRM